MKNETARREIESLDYYLQNHTDDYSEESHTAMMMAIKALEQQPCEDCISRKAVIDFIIDNYGVGFNSLTNGIRDYLPPVTPRINLALTSQDCISREAVIKNIKWWFDKIELNPDILIDSIVTLPSVKPKYTDEEIDKIQAVEQAYVDKMVELAVEETKRPKGKWINDNCSICGYGVRPWNNTPYCPNCGAEMKGGGEE